MNFKIGKNEMIQISDSLDNHLTKSEINTIMKIAKKAKARRIAEEKERIFRDYFWN